MSVRSIIAAVVVLLCLRGAGLRAQEPFEVPLRINMGGDETVDSQGRLWLGDRPCGLAANADPLGIRPNLNGGFNAICNWCAPDALSMEQLDFDPAHAGDRHILSTIRWDEGADGDDFYLELPVANGVYDINLYFDECCCTGRFFKIDVQGAVIYDEVSYLSYDPDAPALGKVGLLEVTAAPVNDGILRIGFLPCPECPGVSDTNAIISAIEVLESAAQPCDDPPLGWTCAGGFECTVGQDGQVTGTWRPPLCGSATGYEVFRDGALVATLAGDATSFTDAPEGRTATYELIVTTNGDDCEPLTCTISDRDFPFEVPLRINMGGEETVDSQGRLWLGDRSCADPENVDPLGIRPNRNGGTNAICDWCFPEEFSMEELDFDPFSIEDQHILSTIRWDNGGDADDFYVELRVPNGTYDVNLYFDECCCTGRHFKIEVQGNIEFADVSYLSYSADPALNKVGLLEVPRAVVTDGILRIGFLPCPECPGVSDTNAIISAIEVLPSEGDPCEDAPLGRRCAQNLECSVDENGAVTGTWTAPVCGQPASYEVRRDGEMLMELPGDATAFTDTLNERSAIYEVIATLAGGDGPCAPLVCSVARRDVPFEIPLRIIMGGAETEDSQGRLWLGDRPCALGANADPLGIRPNLNSGFNAICDWCAPEPLSMEDLELDPFSPEDAHIFSTIRWDVGGDADDFYVELRVPNDTYDVNLYFNECCCTGRHFKIDVEGTIEHADVSYLSYAEEPALGKVGMLDVRGVTVDDEILRIGFLPCAECPGVSDTNAIINAIEVLEAEGGPCDDPPPARLCPVDFQCAIDAGGQVTATWEAPRCSELTGYEVLKNGRAVMTLPPDATGFTDVLGNVASTYKLVTLLPGGAGPCASTVCAFAPEGVSFPIPLRINMGGVATEDSYGNIWFGDGPGAGDPLNIRPDDFGGTNTIENWEIARFQPDSFDNIGFDPDHPGDRYIFNTIRWDNGGDANDFRLEIPMANGEYDVNLYFTEGCCTNRHFKIEIEDELVDDDVSYLDYDPDIPDLGRSGVLIFEGIEVFDTFMGIGFLPCPECPDGGDVNAIIDAVEILGEPPPAKPLFNRADPNDDGTANIADSVFILSNLFSGGADPTCRESADVNDDGSVNITDPISLLTFLFGGGAEQPVPPAAPGTPDSPCGPDPDGSVDLGCESYRSCQ